VKKYMRFRPDGSLVFINGCSSDNPSVQSFKDSFFASQATTFLGWSKKVKEDDARETAQFLFDRLLGEEAVGPNFMPEMALQRPFDLASVLSAMASRIRSGGLIPLLESTDIYNLELSPTQDGVFSYLRVTKRENAVQLVRPSIEGLDVIGPETLQLNGLFGENPNQDGVVTLGDVPLDITSWTSTNITCTSSTPLSPGTVVVRDHGVT